MKLIQSGASLYLDGNPIPPNYRELIDRVEQDKVILVEKGLIRTKVNLKRVNQYFEPVNIFQDVAVLIRVGNKYIFFINELPEIVINNNDVESSIRRYLYPAVYDGEYVNVWNTQIPVIKYKLPIVDEYTLTDIRECTYRDITPESVLQLTYPIELGLTQKFYFPPILLNNSWHPIPVENKCQLKIILVNEDNGDKRELLTANSNFLLEAESYSVSSLIIKYKNKKLRTNIFRPLSSL